MITRSFSTIAAVLMLFGTGGCITWDGKMFGGPSVDVIEAPINAAAKAAGVPVPAGTILVAADKAVVARKGKQADEFPLLGVTTNHYDSKGTETFPPYTTVKTPIYGPVTNISTPQAQAPAPMLVTPEAMQQIAALWMQYKGAPPPIEITPSTPSPLDSNTVLRLLEEGAASND
jgi:hypothetical protein